MADCPTDNSRLFGGAIVLEVAEGCPDAMPSEEAFQALAAGTSKGFDFSPNTVTSDADDTQGYVENIVTNSDFTISFEGEVRKNDKLDQFGIGKFIRYYNEEVKARRQPTLWVRMEYGPVTFVGYMVITALSSDGGTNDIVTFSTEFKVGAAETIQVLDSTDTEEPEVPVAGISVNPVSGTVAVGQTVNFQVNVEPSNASNKLFTVTSSNDSMATAMKIGTSVTVTGVAAGQASITVITDDNSFSAVYTVTVTEE